MFHHQQPFVPKKEEEVNLEDKINEFCEKTFEKLNIPTQIENVAANIRQN
jgi:hypothetical protein